MVKGPKAKRVGKAHRFVFHPSERRLIGILVKRPDAALMFHRKDLFAALSGLELQDGVLVLSDKADASDKGAIKSLGVDWDSCVLWIGLPIVTQDETFLGYVEDVRFDGASGEVESIFTENGAANNVVLGRRHIPAAMIKGFKRGIGANLVVLEGENGEEQCAGAILVSDEAAALEAEGGVAAAAGKATAVVADKAKKGAAKAKAAVQDSSQKAKPVVEKAARKAGEAVESGAYAAGKQLGKTTGMFAAFKEEFDKALHEDD